MDNVFGKRLKEIREERGISQIKLASAIGVSKAIVSLWENGLREPTLSNLVLLEHRLSGRQNGILNCRFDFPKWTGSGNVTFVKSKSVNKTAGT